MCRFSSPTSATKGSLLFDAQVLVDLLESLHPEDAVEDDQLQYPEDGEAQEVGAVHETGVREVAPVVRAHFVAAHQAPSWEKAMPSTDMDMNGKISRRK